MKVLKSLLILLSIMGTAASTASTVTMNTSSWSTNLPLQTEAPRMLVNSYFKIRDGAYDIYLLAQGADVDRACHYYNNDEMGMYLNVPAQIGIYSVDDNSRDKSYMEFNLPQRDNPNMAMGINSNANHLGRPPMAASCSG